MENMKKIPSRSEVKKEYTWAIEDMYANKSLWEKDIQRAKETADKCASLKGQLGESADKLLTFLRLTEDLMLILDDVSGYASRVKDVDTSDPEGQSMESAALSLLVECDGKVSFSSPEILEISDETLEKFYKDQPALEDYRRYLTDLRRSREHILSPEVEKVLADAGEMAQTAEQSYSMLNNADLKFPNAVDSLGNEHELTHGSFIPLLESDDRELRRSAFKTLYSTYGNIINTSASLLAGQINSLRFFAKTRKYDSTLEAALDATNVPVSVYKNLIEAVHKDISYLHRYMKLRKKLLNLDELHMYDLYTPMVADADEEIPFAKAAENVMEATKVFGEEYSKVLKEAFDSRWIDIYENKGKRSGAYSSGQTVHPYVLLNYKGTLDSQFTLCHEMGHAMHSYLSTKNQRPVDRHYVIFVAEVASTCNEAILMKSLLAKTNDKKTRAYLINYFLEQFRTTLYRQAMFAEFELKINELSERGESLTASKLNEIYLELNRFYYGSDVVADEEIAMEWARIPHFYYDYYVFQYSTGFSAAIALSEKILTGDQKDVENYLNFLSGGCSKDPISLLKGAGVDMTTSEPVHNALKLFNSLLDEMEELTK